jgi:hypothetical protein
MTITVRIDRIVLDGIAVGPVHVAGLRAAITAELTELLARSVPPRHSARRRAVAGGVIADVLGPDALGRHIARAVVAAVCGSAGRPGLEERG